MLTLPEQVRRVYVTDDDSHLAIPISPPPDDRIPHGCHEPVTVPLSH